MLLSYDQLFATPWTVACQASLSMEFSRQEYWSGLPCPSPGHLPNPQIKPRSPILNYQGNPGPKEREVFSARVLKWSFEPDLYIVCVPRDSSRKV